MTVFHKLFLMLFCVLLSGTTQAQPLPAGSRIGYLTGTFDPPHRGHEQMVRDTIAQLGLTQLIVIPNFKPGHKPGANDFATRHALAELAFGEIPKVLVADETFAQKVSVGGVSVQINEMAEANPSSEIIHVMGDDSFEKLESFHVSYRSNVSLAVAQRGPEVEIPVAFDGHKVLVVRPQVLGLSSTAVRHAIEGGTNVGAEILNPKVLRAIQASHLYQAIPALNCEWLFSGHQK